MLKALAIIGAAMLMTGCGDEAPIPPPPAKNTIDLDAAKDGVYIVESSRDAQFGNGTLTLTIKSKKIIVADFTGYDIFGKVKGADYGSFAGKDSDDYRKAQAAVAAIKIFPAQLVETVKRAVAEASQ